MNRKIDRYVAEISEINGTCSKIVRDKWNFYLEKIGKVEYDKKNKKIKEMRLKQ